MKCSYCEGMFRAKIDVCLGDENSGDITSAKY